MLRRSSARASPAAARRSRSRPCAPGGRTGRRRPAPPPGSPGATAAGGGERRRSCAEDKGGEAVGEGVPPRGQGRRYRRRQKAGSFSWLGRSREQTGRERAAEPEVVKNVVSEATSSPRFRLPVLPALQPRLGGIGERFVCFGSIQQVLAGRVVGEAFAAC